MKNIKAQQKSRVIYEFGVLIQPLEALVRSRTPPTLHECRIAIATVQSGDPKWREGVRELATFAPDNFFNAEFQALSHVAEVCCRGVGGVIGEKQCIDDPLKRKERLEEEVCKARINLMEYIDRIPVEWEPIIFQANTPFTSYLRIKEAVDTVKYKLHYFDRYIKPEFFALFLNGIDRNISIRLVTTSGNARYGVTAISPIAALAQREFSDFNVIEVTASAIHDRNLRIDDQLFTLGPGVDAAGLALTNFGPSDSSIEALEGFDSLISSGRSLF